MDAVLCWGPSGPPEPLPGATQPPHSEPGGWAGLWAGADGTAGPTLLSLCLVFLFSFVFCFFVFQFFTFDTVKIFPAER